MLSSKYLQRYFEWQNNITRIFRVKVSEFSGKDHTYQEATKIFGASIKSIYTRAEIQLPLRKTKEC